MYPPLLILFILYCLFLLFITLRFRYTKKQNYIARKIKEEQKERLYESKLRFFTKITHELYKPLTLINDALEQIKKEDNSDRAIKYSDILQSNILI